MAGGTIAIVGDGTVGAAGVLGKKDTILQSPESVKPDCFKLFELRMKSSAYGILSNMFFCTHLVQIQSSKFLLKKQCLSVF